MAEDYGLWGLPDYSQDYYGGYGDIYAPTYSGYAGGYGPGAEPSYVDATDGQTYPLSEILANPEKAAAFKAEYGGNYSLGVAGNPLGGPQAAGQLSPTGQPTNWGNIIGGGATGLAGLLGIAGIAQGLMGGGNTSTTITQPGQSPLAGAAGQAGLGGYQQALNFGFGGPGGGLAGQLQGMAPAQQQAQLQALQGASGAFQNNPFLAQQPAQPPTSPTVLTLSQAYDQFGRDAVDRHQVPGLTEVAPERFSIGGTPGSPGGNPLLNQLAQQVQGYGQAQGGMLNAASLGAMGLQNPAYAPLMGQAQGMAQGNLPALNPQLRAQVGATFEPAYQDLNRYLDTSLQQALERSRQQGFAGGNEVLREGTPGTILAPMWAEGMRQQGTLGGQRAQAELGLAQSLPQMGGNLANQLFMQELERNKAMQTAAQAYTAPSAVALQGGLGLGNLNQNMIQLLGNLGQQGSQNQLNFLQAASAPLQGLTGLSNAAQQGAGMTQTQNTPFNLMSAFAPTANLLGGIGGAMGGYNATQQPMYSGLVTVPGRNPAYAGWSG